jgi:hypothetical protein
MDVRKKLSMWSLGPVKTMGIDFLDVVNKDVDQITTLTGDWYDQETRLFELYKEKLKLIGGR